MNEDGQGGLSETRAAEAEATGRVRLGFIAAEAGYEDRVADAVFPGDGADGVSASDLPLALTGPEGQAVAERWLSEARVARDQLRFALPPSRRALGAGAMVALGDGSTWRIDRVEDRGARAVEAVRVEPSVFEPSEAVEELAPASEFVAPVPVSPVFMDLPLLTGGGGGARAAPGRDGDTVAGVGGGLRGARPRWLRVEPIGRAAGGRGCVADAAGRGGAGGLGQVGPLRVRIAAGQLAAAEAEAVLNGANVAAIGSGGDGDWEVIQFAGATLVGEGLWDIGLRLRGQQGTDGVMPGVWPEGSLFVLRWTGRPGQIEHAGLRRGAWRGINRVGRVRGAAWMTELVSKVCWLFQGVWIAALRAGFHLRAVALGGDLALAGLRVATRIERRQYGRGGIEVLLGRSHRRAYLLRITAECGRRGCEAGAERGRVLPTPRECEGAGLRPARLFTHRGCPPIVRPVRAGAICKDRDR